MTRTDLNILEILNTIEGTGSFMTSGVRDFVLPGLYIEGFGELGFPVNQIQAKALIQTAIQAPFGKGMDTVTDTSVRKSWEIDASLLTFKNEEWQYTLKGIIKRVQKGLGIERHDIKTSLYKLLIYEEGGFFLPHKDSEKEAGMFGTLIVGLPAKHTGGELHLQFLGEKEEVDFSIATGNYKLPYVAFYADCEHEIKPVTSGYRVCLVYNLIQEGKGMPLNGPQFDAQINDLADQMGDWYFRDSNSPKVILLGHEYTPANFSLDKLKHNDHPRAFALIEAAKKMGIHAKLGLLTHYQMGDLEGAGYYDYDRRYGSRYDNDDEGTMGDIHEEYTEIKEWIDDDLPSLGVLSVNEKDIITDLEFANGDPTEQEQEGYTGNAGMTLEYWYHYGAVVFWQQRHHFKFLQSLSPNVQMNWLSYYIQHWEHPVHQGKTKAKQLIESFDITKDTIDDISSYNLLIETLIKIGDNQFFEKYGLPVLPLIFEKIDHTQWEMLLKTFDIEEIATAFEKVGTSNNIEQIAHLLQLVTQLANTNHQRTKEFVEGEIELIPIYLEDSKLHLDEYRGYGKKSKSELAKEIIDTLLNLNKQQNLSKEWIEKVIEQLTQTINRTYVNDVIFSVLKNHTKNQTPLFKSLYQICSDDVIIRVEDKPMPPENWTRTVPKPPMMRYFNYKKVWKILTPFMESPTQRQFNYTKNENHRKEVISAILSSGVDLKYETIKQGRPYTLRLTKTQKSYDEALQQWEEDVKILKHLRQF